MAANVMASKDREVNLILINSVCGSVVVARAKEQPVWLLFLARGLKVFFFCACTAMHVRARTYEHVRTKERPVWLSFLACGFKVFFFSWFARRAMQVRARTYGHALIIAIAQEPTKVYLCFVRQEV